jgi:hypothetical protein
MIIIRFICPHCKNSASAPSTLAGKKAKCRKCQKVLTVPRPQAAAAAAVENLVAAALSEQTAAPAAEQPRKPIEFNCTYCDENVQVPAELAGKQTPCPECRRIIKVPVPKKAAAKDWRKATPAGLSALHKDGETAPEGEWGTATTSRKVSQQSLLEAEVIPLEGARLTPGQWAGRIAVALLAVALLSGMVWAGMRLRVRNQQRKLLQEALTALETYSPSQGELTLKQLTSAEVHRAAGEYHARANQADLAHRALDTARNEIVRDADKNPQAGLMPSQRDPLLVDLSLTYIALGGTASERNRGFRISWDDVVRELRRTAPKIETPEASADFLRRVSRELIAKGRLAEAEAVPQIALGNPTAEQTAQVGVEMLRADQKEPAKRLAARLLQPYQAKTARPDAQAGPLGPNQIALAVALELPVKTDRVEVPIAEAALKDPYPEVREGNALGLACQGKWDQARQVANSPGSAPVRLEALLAVAELADGKELEHCKPALVEALTLRAKELAATPQTPWLLLRLARLAGHVGLNEQHDLVKPLLDGISDKDLRARARLELLRGEIADSHADVASLNEKAKQADSPIMLEVIARHLARQRSSSDVMDMVDRWEPRTAQPLGIIGAALGEQDRSQ